jgi:membrane fusion protein, multidrug efflux system
VTSSPIFLPRSRNPRDRRLHAFMSATGVAMGVLIALATARCDSSASASTREAAASKPSKASMSEPIRVRTAAAEKLALPETLEVTGSLLADESAAVSAQRDGRVTDVRVERGSAVAAGDVLATLEDREARANLADATASLAWTVSESKRYAELATQGIISAADNQRRQLDRESAAARVDLARKAVEDTIIRAPFAGVISERKVSAGAYVKKGDPIASLVRIDPIRAELAIPESAVAAVRNGQTIQVFVEAYPSRSFAGKIAYVGPALKSDARTLVVEALLPNAEKMLKPGLFARARVEMARTSPALFVPQSAIVTDSGVSRVFVLGSHRVSERIVSLGEKHADMVEIRAGVAAGERVALSPDRRLADGLGIAR